MRKRISRDPIMVALILLGLLMITLIAYLASAAIDLRVAALSPPPRRWVPTGWVAPTSPPPSR
jgi:hypothetical protein